MRKSQDLAAKPYYRCLSCERFRNVCGGMPTRGMNLQEWCEYMRDVKEHAHLTNAHIAEGSEVSIRTIERIMAINIEQDIMRSVARRIELVLIGQVGEHTCMNSDGSAAIQISNLMAQIEHLRKENERYAKIIDKYID